MLGKMLERQRKLMAVLGVTGGPNGEGKGGALPRKEMFEAAVGMSCEAAEVLNVMNKANRPWVTETDFVPQTKGETIDVVFYALEIFSLFGLSEDDVFEMYSKKYIFNLARVAASHTLAERESAMRAVKGMPVLVPVSPKLLKAFQCLKDEGHITSARSIDEEECDIIENPKSWAEMKNGKVY